ncbi:hypothetical protein ELI49_13800 [Rhizobium ruizarguesonis]|uniref:hypothetical protein n=1 Tax=Rhizobium ruizarguesonis TaxID=2081791 RepID=UPI00103141AA|nr:hypothetical protein [Rhizobium ruizarguesonis]QIJ41222.1 hypothetical protein G7039_14290 [Rhizobium leguminosarum]NEH26540.1 hypothetical protein [Rhizobium ruizarguesonis]TAU10728.1 hypothetical protein ELI49_13800 [Rhizobium ruizarguesonis]TAW78345.1 hypothetical protein ELI10_14710 [Rhizobium ruizarguesonis]TAX15310.1 hypothetical protein ELI09_14760 [Rhizobium ruizarguesonis]
MRFRLFYEGELHSSGNNSKRPGHKHDIRREFHKQFRELWRVDGNLNEWMDYAAHKAVPEFQRIADRHGKLGYHWVPLVSDETFTHCSIDVLMLRPGKVGGLILDTDIDNRLKTLFDALQIPTSQSQLPETPASDEDPFFVLLEKDSLISSVSVTTDRLLATERFIRKDVPDSLTLSLAQSANRDHVVLIITVAIHATKTTLDNLHLIG